MPTYDYECDACGKSMEIFQRISDDPLKKCPECGQDKLRRLFGTGAAIVFKGSGFYQTDYRSQAYKSAAEKESKADSGGTAKSDSDKSSSTDKGTEKPAESPKRKKPAD